MTQENEQNSGRTVGFLTLTLALMVAVGSVGCSGGGEEAASASSDPAQATVVPEEALTAYFAIQEALVSDSTEGIDQSAEKLNASWPDKRIASSASKVAQADGLEDAREAFKGISTEVIQGLKAGEYQLAEGEAHQAYCPMAKAAWLQQGDQVVNPYYGSSMLHCGEIQMTYQSD